MRIGTRQHLTRLLYRMISPRHPRAYVHVIWEEVGTGKSRIVTEGMGRYQLPELEVFDCPNERELMGFVHGMVCNAMAALVQSVDHGVPVEEGDVINLHCVNDPVRVLLASGSDMTLRLVDIEQSPGTDFPAEAISGYVRKRTKN